MIYSSNIASIDATTRSVNRLTPYMAVSSVGSNLIHLLSSDFNSSQYFMTIAIMIANCTAHSNTDFFF